MISEFLEIPPVELTFLSEPVASPWDSRPLELVTWWEMQQLSAYGFYAIGYFLETLKAECMFKCGAVGDEIPLPEVHTCLDDATAERAIKSLKQGEEICREIGMNITSSTMADVAERIEGKSATYNWFLSELNHLQRLIRKEMSGKFFIYVAPERARFWPTKRQQHVFGEIVYKAFPSTFYDIGQAGVCLAMGCTTACVFHLMRVLETGLRSLGNVFGVSLDHASWGPAILQIESKIRNMHVDPRWNSLPDCKQQQQFYADAASNFGILK